MTHAGNCYVCFQVMVNHIKILKIVGNTAWLWMRLMVWQEMKTVVAYRYSSCQLFSWNTSLIVDHKWTVLYIYNSIYMYYNIETPRTMFMAGLWSRSRRLGLETYQCVVSRKIVIVSVSGSRRLGLGHLHLVPRTNFWPNRAGHSMQWERALDVVSLCCSYYCSSY